MMYWKDAINMDPPEKNLLVATMKIYYMGSVSNPNAPKLSQE
jgi:hypothetical protein